MTKNHPTDKYGDDLPLTVAALIRALEKCPPDALVSTEGCDCYGPAASVRLTEDKRVEVSRSWVGGGFLDERK